MSHIDPDDLAMIALGELSLDAEQAEHVGGCHVCADELAALARTVAVARTLPETHLATPDDRVWRAIEGEIAAQPDIAVSHHGEQSVSEARQRDGSMTEPSMGGDASPSDHVARGSRRRSPLVIAAAGIVTALAAVVVVVVLALPRPVDIATATLDAFPDHPGASGTAALERAPDGSERVVVKLDADVAPDGFREVWLIAADGSDLVSLGVLDGTSGTFSVPAEVDTARFSVVDISQEPDDGDETHSGDSIVRGELQSS